MEALKDNESDIWEESDVQGFNFDVNYWLLLKFCLRT